VKADLLQQRELTDELVEEARRLEGLRLRIEQWNHEATLDTIRHWCWGVGDTNPLFLDESYAGAGPYGGIVAPPSWLGTVYNGAIGLGLPGIQPFGAGSAWEYLEPIQRGDRIEVDARVGPVGWPRGKRPDASSCRRR
jgi:acyl dehydratase